jgi:ABC-type Fe3+/spermidine/putrescine transport system ATPase subunit
LSTNPQTATKHAQQQAAATRGVRVENIVHHYGEVEVLRQVSLSIQPGEFVTLLGPSGSGKTTLLRIIAGLVAPAAGRVLIGEIDVTSVPPEKRDIGLVFQNYALFPHLTAGENVAFPLKMRGVARDQIRERVRSAVRLVGLYGMEDRYPAQLSGGQQQRVALARAIVFQPKVLLLDEPLGALDKQLRQHLGVQLRRLQREIGITTIYVTHDREEAFILSNRVAIMHHGSIVQFDTPNAIYQEPTTSFVAHFVSELNDFQGKVSEIGGEYMLLRTPDQMELRAKNSDQYQVGSPAVFGIRLEQMTISPSPNGAKDLSARVKTVIFGGSWVRCELVTGDDRLVVAESRGQSKLNFGEGDQVWIGYDPDHVLVFPELHREQIVEED